MYPQVERDRHAFQCSRWKPKGGDFRVAVLISCPVSSWTVVPYSPAHIRARVSDLTGCGGPRTSALARHGSWRASERASEHAQTREGRGRDGRWTCPSLSSPRCGPAGETSSRSGWGRSPSSSWPSLVVPRQLGRAWPRWPSYPEAAGRQGDRRLRRVDAEMTAE